MADEDADDEDNQTWPANEEWVIQPKLGIQLEGNETTEPTGAKSTDSIQAEPTSLTEAANANGHRAGEAISTNILDKASGDLGGATGEWSGQERICWK